MYEKRSLFFVEDILVAMTAIEHFVEDTEFSQLVNDDKTSSAVIRKFEIIGEASKRIPQKWKERYPRIPWKAMSGMRDRLIHAYFGIDFKLVWHAIKDDIPKLKPHLKRLLDDMKNSQ